MKINKYILEITVFFGGAVVMIFELVGSRILGPYFGTSIFVWTSLIGIILGSLSLGYYFGGRMADKKASLDILSLIIFLSAIFIFLTLIIKTWLLVFLQTQVADVKWAATIASVLLFSPTSVLLGMVSPYAAKLKLSDLHVSGATIGNLYAISTVGSIVGTFLAGFYLIPQFGTNHLLMILTIVLVLLSAWMSVQKFFNKKLFFLLIITVSWIVFDNIIAWQRSVGFIDIDTAYNRIWIYDHKDADTGRRARVMGINNENHSSMFLDSEELASGYSKFYHLARHFYPDFRSTLLLGGAGYSFPKNFLLSYPQATMDVVEIDPQVTELARKYFRLSDNPRLNIYHEDGRVYLNKTDKKYDVIFGDAFASRYSLPYQLTTKEAVQKKYDILNDNGIVILNLISAIDGEKGQFLRAEYATYQAVFPRVYLLPTAQDSKGTDTQNIVLIALKSDQEFLPPTDPELSKYWSHLWTAPIAADMPVLTDDFSPVDYYINQAL